MQFPEPHLIPWITGLLAGAVVLLVFGLKRRTKALRRQRELGRMGGMLPPALREPWSEAPEAHLRPTGKVLTVMFVHVVGFAVVAQRRSPEEAYRWLRRLLGELADEIHQHGGIVDATLGDSVLAIFGYRSPEAQTSRDHGDAALRCAVQMQVNNAKRMMGAGERHEPVLPLRIGINTAPIYVGDVGMGERLDFTPIGHGVNVAKRYEYLCENNCILMGRSTRDVLTEVSDREVDFQARQIPVKHGEDLQRVWEARPLWRHPSMAERANAAFRKFVEPDRAEERWGVPEDCGLSVAGPHGHGVIENFSFSGLGVRFSEFLGKDAVTHIELKGPSAPWNEHLAEAGLARLGVEVRWGSPCEGGYRLGFQIRGLTPVQRQQLLVLLRQALRQRHRQVA